MLGGEIQPWHIIVLLVVLFLLFGAKRMPDMARSVGQSLRIFKSEMRQNQKETEEVAKRDSATVPPPAAVENTTGAPVADAPQKQHNVS